MKELYLLYLLNRHPCTCTGYSEHYLIINNRFGEQSECFEVLSRNTIGLYKAFIVTHNFAAEHFQSATQ